MKIVFNDGQELTVQDTSIQTDAVVKYTVGILGIVMYQEE